MIYDLKHLTELFKDITDMPMRPDLAATLGESLIVALDSASSDYEVRMTSDRFCSLVALPYASMLSSDLKSRLMQSIITKLGSTSQDASFQFLVENSDDAMKEQLLTRALASARGSYYLDSALSLFSELVPQLSKTNPEWGVKAFEMLADDALLNEDNAVNFGQGGFSPENAVKLLNSFQDKAQQNPERYAKVRSALIMGFFGYAKHARIFPLLLELSPFDIYAEIKNVARRRGDEILEPLAELLAIFSRDPSLADESADGYSRRGSVSYFKQRPQWSNLEEAKRLGTVILEGLAKKRIRTPRFDLLQQLHVLPNYWAGVTELPCWESASFETVRKVLMLATQAGWDVHAKDFFAGNYPTCIESVMATWKDPKRIEAVYAELANMVPGLTLTGPGRSTFHAATALFAKHQQPMAALTQQGAVLMAKAVTAPTLSQRGVAEMFDAAEVLEANHAVPAMHKTLLPAIVEHVARKSLSNTESIMRLIMTNSFCRSHWLTPDFAPYWTELAVGVVLQDARLLCVPASPTLTSAVVLLEELGYRDFHAKFSEQLAKDSGMPPMYSFLTTMLGKDGHNIWGTLTLLDRPDADDSFSADMISSGMLMARNSVFEKINSMRAEASSESINLDEILSGNFGI